MAFECVLARNFLAKGNLGIVFLNKGDFVSDVHDREAFESAILSIDIGDGEDFVLTTGDGIDHYDKDRLFELYNDYYVRPERPSKPRIFSEIKLNMSDDRPFYCNPRSLSYAERSELQILLDKYLEKEYIRPSESEFVSPIVLVRKRTGELRMCVYYRVLNEVTAKDNYPIPLIDDLLDVFSRRKFFTKLDLKNFFSCLGSSQFC